MTETKKDPYDKTSTKRGAAHLTRLAAGKGKRLPVDFTGDHISKLDDLKAAGYGTSAADVIRKAIDRVHAELAVVQGRSATPGPKLPSNGLLLMDDELSSWPKGAPDHGSPKAEVTKQEMLDRVRVLSDEMDGNDDENRAMQAEIDALYAKIDAQN
jgi:uncharacterized protein (DUF2267 family)